jgi:transcription elongation factor
MLAAAFGSKREGHFYVEARTEKAVSDAVEGLRGVLRAKPMVRVPHAEMTDALTVIDSGRQDLQVGGWVRILGTGIYRNDLAQVLRPEGDGTVTVKVVPRIEYGALRQRYDSHCPCFQIIATQHQQHQHHCCCCPP